MVSAKLITMLLACGLQENLRRSFVFMSPGELDHVIRHRRSNRPGNSQVPGPAMRQQSGERPACRSAEGASRKRSGETLRLITDGAWVLAIASRKAMLNRPASEFRSSTDTDFDVVVLGAGVIGINTAYWAMRAGRKVCIIDRQPAAGLETSFANGGQISVSHAEPWANPSAPLKILKWLFDDRSPLLFRPKLDIHQWLWIAQFLVDCLPQRADRHTTEIVRLATESRRLLREIREREDLHYDQRRQGILHFYRDQREFDAAIHVTELMREHGCNRNVIGRSEVLAIEPAFEARINEVVGATYT